MVKRERTLHSEDFRVIADNTTQDELYSRSRERWDHHTRTLTLAPAPLHVDIEPTNCCDLRCPFCERYAMNRKQGMMSMDLFRKIIDECQRIGVDSVKLNLWGESLLHPNLIEMIAYAKKNSSLILQFNTNANMLKSEVAKGFVVAGLDRLTISLDGMDEDVYARLRIGGQLEKVMSNIETLMKIRHDLNSSLPQVTVQMIRTTENSHETQEFIDFWEKRVDRVTITNICTTADDKVLRYSERENKKVGRKPCEQLWQRLSVFWDGTVTVCCRDYDGFLSIGSLAENSLSELWTCEALEKMRTRHKDCSFSGLVCDKCTKSFEFSSDEHDGCEERIDS